jgi:hypothetical protein
MFCHQYPTGACVTGNGEVRSLWDNVTCDCQSQGGRELGLCGRVNPCESLINVVTEDKPKRLLGLDQKVSGQVRVFLTHVSQMTNHRPRGETSPTLVLTRNVVSLSSSLWGKQTARRADGVVGMG